MHDTATEATRHVTAGHITAGHVTAVLLVYKNGPGACGVLDAVKAQHVRPGRIIVVDNGSGDGGSNDAAAQIAAAHPDVEVIALDENVGVGAGHNTGWRAALADPACAYIWTLEHDAIPEPDCLATLLAAHEQYYNGASQNEGKQGVVFPTMVMPYDTAERLYLALRFFRFRRLVQPTPDDPPRHRPAFSFNGTLLSTAVIRHVGMLTEEYFFGREDSDFSLRCLAAGVELLMVPAAQIHHNIYRNSRIIDLGRVVILTPGRAGTFRIYYGMRNSVTLMRREHAWWKAWVRYGGGYLLAQLNDLIFGPERGDRLRARSAAFRDGMQGRLGRATYPFLR